MARLVLLAFAFLGALLLAANAQAERRVALVIGNGTYQNAGTLANPVNDATDVAAKLRSIGFEVIEGHDLAKRDLERKIGEFSDALSGASTGLFFYAGHGLQVEGRNYIVPTDAQLDVPAKLRLEAVPMDDVIDIIEQQAATSIVFLDACRNNPFVRSLSTQSRSAAPLQGLAQFDATRGSFIAFSTAPGAVAADGSGRNSPFASALIQHIAEPGQSINDMMIKVRLDVIAATRDVQRPWEQGSLLQRFEFVPGAQAPVAESDAPAVDRQPAAVETQKVANADRSVGDTASVEDFIRDRYLTPKAGMIAETVRQIYTSPATVYGKSVAQKELIKAKNDWFSQLSGWTLALDPGSLVVTPRGESRVDAAFVMSYDYAPKAAGVPHAVGKARVVLGLIMADGDWRIASETSQAAQ